MTAQRMKRSHLKGSKRDALFTVLCSAVRKDRWVLA
jgi:hypothetical protein